MGKEVIEGISDFSPIFHQTMFVDNVTTEVVFCIFYVGPGTIMSTPVMRI